MTFALRAGELFKLDKGGEFEETIISKCVDQYIAVSVSKYQLLSDKSTTGAPKLATSFAPAGDDLVVAAGLISPTTPFSQSTLPSKSLLSRQSTETMLENPISADSNAKNSGSASGNVDRATHSALQDVIERLFESCLVEGRYRQVVGIAVEARNLDVIRQVIKRASSDAKKSKLPEGSAGQAEELMEYVLDICMGVVQERTLRTEILRLILDLLNEIPSPDYFSIAKCVVYLNQDSEASTMLRKLVQNSDQTSLAVAYQIAFDLYDNGTQEFLGKVRRALPGEEKKKDTSSKQL